MRLYPRRNQERRDLNRNLSLTRCLNLRSRLTLNRIPILIRPILIQIRRIQNRYLSLRQNSFRPLCACCWSRNH